MKKICLVAALALSISACSGDIDRLNDICEDMLETSEMTDDCSKMADAYEKYAERMTQHYKNIKADGTDKEDETAFLTALSRCARAEVRIMAGACAQNERILARIRKTNEALKQ